MARINQTVFRVEVPVRPEPAIHILRTPPPSGRRDSGRVKFSGLDIAYPPHPRASRDLILQTLGLPRSMFPERTVFLTGDDDLIVPWRMHPKFDLMVPVQYVGELYVRDRWRVEAFVSPSTIGLTYDPDALQRAGLRTLALFPDREYLLRWLSNLLVRLEVHGPGSTFEVEIAQAMALPGRLGSALVSNVGARSPLFTPACVRWLLAEAIAAPPAPFGVPGRDSQGAEIEKFIFPSVANGRKATEQELLRAVFLAHETFHLGSRSERVTAEWVLSVTAAHSFGVHLFSTPEDRLIRARHMWLVPDDHPRIPATEFSPSLLRTQFEAVGGISVDKFMLLTSLVLATVRANVVEESQLISLFERLINERAAGDWEGYKTTVRQWLAASPAMLKSKIRAEMLAKGVTYEGWGTVPTAPTREMMDHPILALSDGSLTLWSPNALSDRAADLPRYLLHLSGVTTVRGHVGRLFEAYVQDRLTDLNPSRHRILDESELGAVLPGKLADYVAAQGRDLLVVEVSSMGTPHTLADGNPGAVNNKLEDYLRKREQASAAKSHQHRIARELLGLNATGVVAEIVVTQDAIPNSPALFHMLGEESFICTADEFELLLDLAQVGWSLPQLVDGWQQSGRPIPLGAYLAEHRAIRSQDLSLRRWSRAVADQFELAAA